MLKNYFRKLRAKKVGVNKQEIKKTVTKRISKEFELNIKTDNFIKGINQEELKKQEMEIHRKLQVSTTGLRNFDY
jgi:hypothetical protein